MVRIHRGALKLDTADPPASTADVLRAVALLAFLTLSACSTSSSPAATASSADAASPDAEPPAPCDPVAITPPPSELGLAPFYAKYLDASGIPVLSSSKTSDLALAVACRITRKMVEHREDVRTQMIARHARVAVIAKTEVTTDVPEHADLYEVYPGTDWNVRARGLGGTVARPVTSVGEENLLCDPADPYAGENILVHELAHGIVNLGVAFADHGFVGRRKAAYDSARAAGKWSKTYAGTNDDEYFAEGVQSFFETNLESTPPDGIHNDIDTRAELETYDPELHALVAEIFTSEAWTPGCP